MRTCTRCRESLSEDRFYFQSKVAGQRKTRCINCCLAYAATRSQRDAALAKARLAADPQKMVARRLAKYHAEPERFRAATKAWRQKVGTERVLAQNLKWREANKDQIRAYAKANLIRSRANGRKYYHQNKARLLAANKQWAKDNRDKLRKTKRAWNEKNRLKLVESRARREAQKRGSRVERISYKRILDRDHGLCWMCGVKPEQVHFDHVMPLSRGGPHIESNIRVACAPCNLKKGARLLAA